MTKTAVAQREVDVCKFWICFFIWFTISHFTKH